MKRLLPTAVIVAPVRAKRHPLQGHAVTEQSFVGSYHNSLGLKWPSLTLALQQYTCLVQ